MKLIESTKEEEPFFAKSIFKLVFVLYKLRKGVEPLDVAKLLLKTDERDESHMSVGATTEGGDCSLTWAGGSQPSQPNNPAELNSQSNFSQFRTIQEDLSNKSQRNNAMCAIVDLPILINSDENIIKNVNLMTAMNGIN